MENSVANKIVRVAFSFVLLACAPLAQAGMLTFDDLKFDGLTSGSGILNSPSYGGFIWDSDFSVGSTEAAGFSDVAASGEQFLFNSNNARFLTIERDTPFDFFGATFGFHSVDVAFLIDITYYLASEDRWFQTSDEYQFLNSSGTTQLNLNLQGIDKLKIDAFGGTFTMDNFRYEESTVNLTEAGSLALLAIGLIGLWAARRRGQLQA